MARAPNEKAELDYIKGMKYKDIAEKYKVSINTVKSWKTRHKWSKDKKSVHTEIKKECTQKKNAKLKDKESIADGIKEVLKNTELNDKQRLFCVLYAKCMNATKAYQKAYKCNYESAMINGSRLLKKDKIRDQVDNLIGEDCNKEFLTKGIIQKYIDIAFADITDYVEFGRDFTVIKDAEGKPQYDEKGELMTKEFNYLKLGESKQVDGTLIGEVSESNGGIKLKLNEKLKALQWLSNYFEMNPDFKQKREQDYNKLQLEKEKFEHQKNIDKSKIW